MRGQATRKRATTHVPEHSSPGTPRGPQAHRYPGAPLSPKASSHVFEVTFEAVRPHALGSPLGSPRRAHRWVHRPHLPVWFAAGPAAQGSPLSSPSRLTLGLPHGLAAELTSGLTARARRWATSPVSSIRSRRRAALSPECQLRKTRRGVRADACAQRAGQRPRHAAPSVRSHARS